MKAHPYKKAGILRAAFDYQDLIGIQLLIDFYQEPDRYLWVKIEAEDPQYRSLDDVVAAKPDGSFELLQIKFTPDPNTQPLGWDWLLEQRGGGTSRLHKWATTFNAFSRHGTIAKAQLRTNRRPDSEFSKCLSGYKIDRSAIGARRWREVAKKLGGSEAAIAFLAEFEFVHSEPLPIARSKAEFAELTIGAVLATPDYEATPDVKHDLSRRLLWELQQPLELAGVLPEIGTGDYESVGSQGDLVPVCLDLWPLPSGFWQNDYHFLGLALPAPYCFEEPIHIVCRKKEIVARGTAGNVATLKIWHDHWNPLHMDGGGSRCGSVTEMAQSLLCLTEQRQARKLGWMVRLKRWQRDSDFGEFKLNERTEFFFD